jgi:hypothetical protein
MKRRNFLKNAGVLSVSPFVLPAVLSNTADFTPPFKLNTRKQWLDYLEKLANPVLTALAADELKEKMPVETALPSQAKERAKYSHLEAVGRLLSGIAPWLQADHLDPGEKQRQHKYMALALKSISNAVNPQAKDYMNWGDEGGQPLVDASFFAYALIRCPKLWQGLDKGTQENVITALRNTHVIKPPENNWLLFAAMIEAFFISINEPFDVERIKYAIDRHQEWYKGDGMFGDGPEFHWDYYNSYVIHPFLYDILKIAAVNDPSYELIRVKVLEHHLRYANIQERLIAADGSYPPIGRSITYRTGAFHHLANMAFRQQLPAQLQPPQVRCALTAVIKKFTENKGVFDSFGWLKIGLYGHQPSLAEGYISTGSLYLCAAILLPLGLPETDHFWTDADEDWTAKKLARGVDLSADHSS